jgi:hypothetical protein
MSHFFSSRLLLTFALLLLASMSPAIAKQDSKAQLRIICVSSLAENQEVVIASHDAEGKWSEHGTLTLRPSLVSDWMPTQAGELHLALRENNTLKSLCHFSLPADAGRVLVALVADTEKNTYEAQVANPVKSEFLKGSVLIFNFSTHTATILLGTKEEKVEAGQRSVAKPVMDDSRMYQTVVSYLDAEGKAVSCYDRYVSSNPNARNMLFLLPDKTLGIRVSSLPLFGEY